MQLHQSQNNEYKTAIQAILEIYTYEKNDEDTKNLNNGKLNINQKSQTNQNLNYFRFYLDFMLFKMKNVLFQQKQFWIIYNLKLKK